MSLHSREKIAIQWLSRLNSPKLSDKDKQDFFAWMDASIKNQCAYLKAEQLWEQGSAFAQIEDNTTNITRGLNPGHFIAIACSLTIMLLCSALLYLTNEAQPQNYQTSIGEQLEYSLDDGSSIMLNTDSILRIKFENKQRLAYLDKGEVFFKVAKDKKRPFHVITTNGSIRVVGTQFSVRHLDIDTTVTVSEGEVKIGATSLRPNQQINVSKALQGGSPVPVDAQAKLAWRKHQLIYNGEALGQVIDDLNRYFKEDILLATSELKSKEVVAVIHLSNLESTTAALANALNLDVEYDYKNASVTLK